MKLIDVKDNEYFLNEYYGNNLENKTIKLHPYRVSVKKIEYTPSYEHIIKFYSFPVEKEKEKEAISNALNFQTDNDIDILNAVAFLKQFLSEMEKNIEYKAYNKKQLQIKMDIEIIENSAYDESPIKKVIAL